MAARRQWYIIFKVMNNQLKEMNNQQFYVKQNYPSRILKKWRHAQRKTENLLIEIYTTRNTRVLPTGNEMALNTDQIYLKK